MSFNLDDLSAPDSAKISFNPNEDIISKHSQLSNFSNRNINTNQLYNPYQYQKQIPIQSPRNSRTSNSIPNNSNIFPQNQNQLIANTPIKIIDFSHGFQINPQALNFLRSIKEEIIIVSVVGKARRGKSYLMNLLLDLIGKNNGFQVASSLQSCAKRYLAFGNPKEFAQR